MANREVTVRVSAQDNFSAVLDRYQREMGQSEQATRRANDANAQATNSFGRLGGAIGGAIAAIGIHQVINFAEDFNELGTQVGIARETFEQLSDSIDPNNTLLERLRENTGGIVDDMSLMSGATRLLSMGLAENSDEVARLTELAVRLGGAMGNDAQTSIENFSLLLANESVLRLDSFGISSARVRQRIDELLASGQALNRSDAFRLAVLEEGGRSLDRLGDAASAAETPLARLQTRIENIAQQGAQNFATGVNATISATEDIVTYFQTETDLNNAAVEWMQSRGIQPGGNLLGNMIFTSEQIAEARQAMQVQEEFVRTQQEGYQAVLDAQAELRNQTPLIADTPFEFSDQFRKPDDAMTELHSRLVSIQDVMSSLNPIVEAGAAAWDQTVAAVNQVSEAYSNISLGALLGESQGNLALGGIGDAVMQQLQERGNLDADALQAAADAYNLAAGRISEETIIMRDTITPILARITEQRGGEVGAQRAAQFEGFLRNSEATGMTPDNNPFYGLFAELSTGTFAGIDFQGLIVEPFDEAFSDIRDRFGVESELSAAASETFTGLPAGIDEARTSADELQGVLDTMTERQYTLRFAVDSSEVDALLAKIGQVNQVQALGQIVRDNGGQVPGQDFRGRTVAE